MLHRQTVVFACLFTWVAATAWAQPAATSRLRYRADERLNCPDEQSFRDTVAARIGYEPFADDAAILIDATIRREGHNLVGSVRVLDAQGAVTGTRDLEASPLDCTELATSMAIAVSILLDPLGEGAQRRAPLEPRETRAPPPRPPSKTRASTPPRPPTRPSPRTTVRVILQGDLGGDSGLAPGLTLGPSFGAGIRKGAFSVLAVGRADLMPTAARATSGDRIEATVFTGGPTGCLGYGSALFCLGLQIGAFQGRGLNVVDSLVQTTLFASADVQGGMELKLTETLGLRFLAEVRVPIVRTSLAINDATVWNAPALA